MGSESEEWRSDLKQTVAWMLALGDIPSGGELSAFSMGATYSEESEGIAYVKGMMYHDVTGNLKQQAFAFGDYLSAEALWSQDMTASNTRDKPAPVVIWLHPYSYNTGYAPQYGQANVRESLANAGYVVMAYDQVGFGIRVTQCAPKPSLCSPLPLCWLMMGFWVPEVATNSMLGMAGAVPFSGRW